jgi:MSHA pilin protein MshD
MAGFTLVEMIIAIVIIGVGLAGVLTAFDINVRSSADPLIRKQMLSVAEEMLEEIQLKPFAVNGTAPSNAQVACGAAGSVRTAFDDVRDYAGYATTGICDIDGTAIAGLEDYDLAIATNDTATLTDGTTAVAGGSTIRVEVTVTHGTETLTHVGWRTDYGS